MDLLTNNIFFGIVLSLLAFEFGLYISRKTKLAILNPLLIAIASVIIFLLAFNIDFEKYNEGAKFINMFLGPATVILAVPLYKQINLLKENFIPIVIGIIVGSLSGIISVFILCFIFNFENNLTISLLSKSVTTPIGIEITNQLGGLVPVTVLSIVLSGIVGAVIGPSICKLFKIKNEIAVGVAIGTASHAVGTTKALELGETQGAMSSLSIGIAGLITVFLVPLCLNIINNLHFFTK